MKYGILYGILYDGFFHVKLISNFDPIKSSSINNGFEDKSAIMELKVLLCLVELVTLSSRCTADKQRSGEQC